MLLMNAGKAVNNAPPFVPTDITGLQLWLDFTDSGNVTLVSGAVSQVNDKSGNSRNATQSTAGSRPSYSGLCPNAANGGGFNGTSSFLTTTSFALAQPHTIICAGKATATTNSYFHDSPSGTRIATLWASGSALASSGNFLFGWAGSGLGNGDSATSDANLDLVSCFIGNGASSQMFINNVQRGTTGQGSGTGGISSGLLIGRNQANSFFLTGYMAHVIIYNTALSTGDRTSVQNYLKTSTGISF